MAHSDESHETERKMPKALSNKKTLSAILTAIFAAGAAAGYWVPPKGSDAACVELKQQHDKDLSAMREQIGDMRTLLDGVLVKTSAADAKLGLLVEMVRDHVAKDVPR